MAAGGNFSESKCGASALRCAPVGVPGVILLLLSVSLLEREYEPIPHMRRYYSLSQGDYIQYGLVRPNLSDEPSQPCAPHSSSRNGGTRGTMNSTEESILWDKRGSERARLSRHAWSRRQSCLLASPRTAIRPVLSAAASGAVPQNRKVTGIEREGYWLNRECRYCAQHNST